MGRFLRLDLLVARTVRAARRANDPAGRSRSAHHALASPDIYMTPIKAVAEDYGGIVHDTGGMAGSGMIPDPS